MGGARRITASSERRPGVLGRVQEHLIWTALSVIFPPLIGFVLALSLNQNIPGRVAAARALLPARHHRADRGRHHVALDVSIPFFGLFSRC